MEDLAHRDQHHAWTDPAGVMKQMIALLQDKEREIIRWRARAEAAEAKVAELTLKNERGKAPPCASPSSSSKLPPAQQSPARGTSGTSVVLESSPRGQSPARLLFGTPPRSSDLTNGARQRSPVRRSSSHESSSTTQSPSGGRAVSPHRGSTFSQAPRLSGPLVLNETVERCLSPREVVQLCGHVPQRATPGPGSYSPKDGFVAKRSPRSS
jgi:hypothetical protein